VPFDRFAQLFRAEKALVWTQKDAQEGCIQSKQENEGFDWQK
jgi:hypothetical protein